MAFIFCWRHLFCEKYCSGKYNFQLGEGKQGLRHRVCMNETGTRCASKHGLDQVLVETELKKGMKLKKAGMDQDRSEGTQQKYWDLRKRQQNLQTQQHILIQNSKSCCLHIPLLSVHLGGTQSCLHPLAPRRTFLLKVLSNTHQRSGETTTAKNTSAPSSLRIHHSLWWQMYARSQEIKNRETTLFF